ncbi:hypothetical protein RchiOBHm_Chr5g0050551 [Rosa chinensis]|uniref:Uncharacterized protein n=1 Tax=Rosa chinensis TaxID=74649 RepID=A0A2P6QF76_ROSCH|nr:hypothetical protein RchiOBHm_Chr5g0050551 [Rosa chinensis]
MFSPVPPGLGINSVWEFQDGCDQDGEVGRKERLGMRVKTSSWSFCWYCY